MNQTIKTRICSMIGRFAPEWCVKKHYSEDEAYLWDLSSDEELQALTKLNLKGEELSKRSWTLETRIYLLKTGGYDCISQISTADEFNLLLARPQNLTAEILTVVLKRFTPNAASLKKMIDKLDKGLLLQVAKNVPSAFNDLKLEQLFGGFLSQDLSKEIALMGRLVSLNDRWISIVLDYMTTVIPNRLPDEARVLRSECFYAANGRGDNLSKYMTYMYTNCISDYYQAKASKFRVENASAMLEFLPTLLRDPKSATSSHKAEYADWVNVLIPLCKTDIIAYRFLRNNLKNIQTFCSSEQYDRAKGAAINGVATTYDWKELYETLSEDDKEALRNLALPVIKTLDDVEYFSSFYPFNEWTNKEDVKVILKKMIYNSLFPVGKLGELETSLQEFVNKALIARSQILCLKEADVANWTNLISETRLTDDAECYMLSHMYIKASVKSEYIKRYGLSKKAFACLLNLKGDHYGYLALYASEKGLSQEEYLLILQSQYAHNAPLLMRHIRN